MKRKQILEMAEKAGLTDWSNYLQRYWIDAHEPGQEFDDFVRLLLAAAREECAQRAEAYAYMSDNFNALAEEIREMGKK